MDQGDESSSISGKRWALIVAVIALSLAIGAYIALHPSQEFRASAMRGVGALSCALAALVCVVRAIVAFRERESLWMKGGMLLLALILAALFYDAIA